MKWIKLVGLVGWLWVSAASAEVPSSSVQATLQIPERGELVFQVVQLTDGLEFPWGMDELPNGGILITEKPGRLRIWQENSLSAPIEGVPEVYFRSQGGLLDVLVDQSFATNQRIYLTYAHSEALGNTTRLLVARLTELALAEPQVLFEVAPYKDTPVHYGGRVAQLPDATLVLTTGDGFDYREQAQRLDSLLGKTVRITPAGRIPQDNPWFGQPTVKPEIWSYGHRNPQGLAFDPRRQVLWQHEHGPKGGDEINAIVAGKNYGWPVATYGKDYSGAIISPYQTYPGTEEPLKQWTPSIAPSGLAVYYHPKGSWLDGYLLVGSLVERDLKLVDPDNPTHSLSLLANWNARIRDVLVTASGDIMVLTDEQNGRLLQLQLVEQRRSN